MKRIAFCGGGTGGHVVPAIAVVEQFEKLGESVDAYLLGSSRRGETASIDEDRIHHVDLYGPTRSMSAHLGAAAKARTFFNRLQPTAVVGLGGYASIAGITAARMMRIPSLLLEQNAVPGRATSLLSRYAGPVLTGLPPANRIDRVGRTQAQVVGTPVRDAVSRLAALPVERVAQARELLVVGGSQGSRVVSEAVLSVIATNIDAFRGVRITHQAVANDVNRVRSRYSELGLQADVRPFFGDIPQRLAAGPIVVSRAGGTTLAELACAGVPSILIPHANAIRNHQVENARVAERVDGTIIVVESQLERLETALVELMTNRFACVRLASRIRQLARPEAALIVAREILHAETTARAA